MKKEILDALKAKFSGVSDTILDRVAVRLAKTVTTSDDVESAVEGVTFQQVLESYGDSRATDAQKTAVANYERKHHLKDGIKIEEDGGEKPQPTEKPKNEPETKGEEKAPAWAQVLIDDNRKLKEQLAALQGERTASTRKNALSKVLEGAPDKIKARIEKDFARLTFADDDDFNTWLGETQADVKELSNDYVVRGGVVTQPKSGGNNGGKETVNPLVTARIKAAESTTTNIPAIAGLQPQTK